MLVAASSDEEAEEDETDPPPPPPNLDLYPPTPTPPPPPLFVGIGTEIAQNGSNVTDSWPQSSHFRVDLRGWRERKKVSSQID